MNKLVMTPGPTQISEQVRNALSIKNTNTDLDSEFLKLYKDTCDKAKVVAKTKESQAIIMLGEAILGLEAACASFIEKDDKVLVIDNGIFGRGFSDFVKLYGGNVTIYKSDYDKGIDANKLESFIVNNGPFKVATLVHCETPTGVTNRLNKIGPLLDKHGIISIVDAVSSFGGEELLMDEWNLDVLLAGSQKCLSATSGGTIIFVSKKAKEYLVNRKSIINSFYLNIKNWLDVYETGAFPYTHSDAIINSLNVALEHLISDNSVENHKKLAEKVRQTINNCGLALYPSNSFSNTLSAIKVPKEINSEEMFAYLINEYNILIGGSLAEFSEKIFRIGHMGENAKEENLFLLFKALDDFFKQKNYGLKNELHVEFAKLI
ncbi:MAG: pyridoxal-phosphate-dependent aminotransferase family protein [Clostridia bacterium]